MHIGELVTLLIVCSPDLQMCYFTLRNMVNSPRVSYKYSLKYIHILSVMPSSECHAPCHYLDRACLFVYTQ